MVQIGLDIAYAPAFNATSLPVTLPNLIFERVGVLFNLAALYSQLASAEDRSNSQGPKRMVAHYQVRQVENDHLLYDPYVLIRLLQEP